MSDSSDNILQQAAEDYQRAKIAAGTGNALETIALCQQVLDRIRLVTDPTTERDQLHLQTLLLLLDAQQVRLQVKADGAHQTTALDFALEAESLAAHMNHLPLLARAKMIKGRVLISAGDVPSALTTLQDALQLARASRDSFVQFMALSSLGHQLIKANLEAGLNLLYEAHELYKQALQHRGRKIQYQLITLRCRLGIGEFDRGNYGQALIWLKESVEGFRSLHMRDDLLVTLNFLGQLYIATGAFEEAEEILFEGTHLLDEAERPNPWNGNNLGLLGKLYLEWGRINEAEEPLQQALRESEVAWNAELISLVRNYYAELLMHPDYSHRDLDAAEKQLNLNLSECEQSGIDRSAILSLSFLGQLKLQQGFIADALSYSQQAVERLERLGTMPALRTEEIFFNHYRVLQAAGALDDASRYRSQTEQVLQDKLNTIPGEDNRIKFLERVPLNRVIRSAANHA